MKDDSVVGKVVLVGALILLLVFLFAPHNVHCHQPAKLDPAPAPSPEPPLAPTIKLPATVSGETGAFVTLAAETNGTRVRWKVLDRGLQLFPAELLKDTKSTVVVAQSPGQYRVICWTAGGNTPSEEAECLVVIGGFTPPAPAPMPMPPTPTPSPMPVAGPCYFIALVDNSKPDAATTKVLESATFKGVATKGHVWRIYDINQPADPSNPKGPKLIEAKNYAPLLKEAGGAPALIVLDKAGGKLLASKVPATEADLASALKPFIGQ